MKTFIHRFLNATILSATLLAPVVVTTPVIRADDRKTYHDRERNEDHEWNNHEDKAYRIWVKENHRKYRDFAKLKEEERQDYWRWRHEHSDAVLKIDIH